MYSPFSKTPVSAMKKQKFNKSSPYLSSPFRQSMVPGSCNVSMNRSLISNTFMDDSSLNLSQRYGAPFPVLVTEALLNAERSSEISVKLESFGYASLVCGRQLLIWCYKTEIDEDVVHCKGLTLPPSDLAHKADLVHLFIQENGEGLPSALAVSPEGHVRFWPNINHEGSSVDAWAELQGQECYSLTSIYPLGCILATTTSSLVIITPTIGDGQPGIVCRTLTLPVGVFAGIGRKVSSFIFGVVPAQTTETKQLNRVLSHQESNGDYTVYVLSGNTLQKWSIVKKDKKENLDQLVFEVDLDRELQQCYAEDVYKEDLNTLRGLKTWCLDMQLSSSGVLILAAAHRPQGFSASSVHYAIGLLNTTSESPPQNFDSFITTQFIQPYQEVMEERLLSYKLLLPTADSLSTYIFNSERVISIDMGDPDFQMNETDFSSSDTILGSGVCDGMALFFTKLSGIICFEPNQKSLGDTRLLETLKDVTIRQSDPNEAVESLPAKLRKAMCSYCNGDLDTCERLIGEMLTSKSKDSTDLDEAVIGLSLGIIDDYPVADPRWCESIPSGSVSSSLIILYQLDDKLKAHECLLNFLKSFQLLEKLSMSKVGDHKIPTVVLLCEHAEKIMAAKAVRLFLTDHNDVIEGAVRSTLDKRGIPVKNNLTPQDVFFREVSAFQVIFDSLLEWEEDQLNIDASVSSTLNAIMTINKLFVGILEAVSDYRRKKGDLYGLQEIIKSTEYLPWTTRKGNLGVQQHIKKQLEINVQHSLKLTDNIQVQGAIFQQYMDMLDFYLEGYMKQLESLKGDHKTLLKKEFEQERGHFLKALLDVGQYDRAAAIAEKYLDFDVLVQICEKTQNSDRLQRYMHQFSSQRFSEFVFKWYLDRGQKGKIFSDTLGGQREVLGKFLQDHDALKWIFYIQEEKWEAAHATLKLLALEETQFLNRKKTLLSLSKLCSMVSDVPSATKNMQIEALNLELDLITHQEALPIQVIESYGIDPKNMRVFTPEEIIDMYTSEDNTTANAYDFKIALDLLHFMKKPLDDPDVLKLRTQIWAKALLRDSWENLDINNPLEAVKETIFFQIIEIAFDCGIDVHEFMPDLEELLQSNELSEISENSTVRFLLEAGYEHIRKIII